MLLEIHVLFNTVQVGCVNGAHSIRARQWNAVSKEFLHLRQIFDQCRLRFALGVNTMRKKVQLISEYRRMTSQGEFSN